MIGASIAWQRGIEWLAVTLMLLNPPVWMDWTWQHAGEPGYLPVVFYIKDVPWNDNAIAVANEFGGVWAIGNEPELQNSFVSPQDAVAFVKKWDDEVGGSWAVPGIILHEDGYKWLGEYLALGGPVGDYWNIHIYFAHTPEEWEEKWNGFKLWMKKHNLERPVIVTETNGWGHADQALILQKIRTIQCGDPLLHTVIWYSDVDYWLEPSPTDMRVGDTTTELGKLFLNINKCRRMFFPMIIKQGK